MTAVSLKLEIDNGKLLLAVRRAPKLLESNMRKAISRIVQTIARSARRDAPKAASTLTHSIQARMISALQGEVKPTVNYAAAVEQGSGPQGPNPALPAGKPPVADILEWVRVKKIVPHDPSMDEFTLADIIAKSIQKKGTRPQPYLGPAVKKHRAESLRRIDEAISKTLEAMR